MHQQYIDPFGNRTRATTLMLVASRARPHSPSRVAKDYGSAPILKVRAGHYVAFLEEAYARFMELPNHGPEVLPNVHPYRGASLTYGDRGRPRVTGIIGRAGWYMGDMSCATMEGTFRAAYASAQSAVAGAEEILSGASAAFSLCRPPGHHAYTDRCSGFCYLNNAAIAAEVLRRKFQRVAIIDFDTHHGDGTQAIFYAPRRRVLRLRAHRPVCLLPALRRLRRRDRRRRRRGREPEPAAAVRRRRCRVHRRQRSGCAMR